MGNNFV